MGLDADELYLENSRLGIFLGAGASFEAGYPLMTTLTTYILDSINTTQLDLISDLIREELNCELDVRAGNPNIEIVTDLLELRAIKLGPEHGNKHIELSQQIRQLIVDALQDIKNPDLTHHIKLLESFRRIKDGTTMPLWIFTTNYDLLIERAAAEVGMLLFDGFLGGPIRFLQASSLNWCHGTISNQYGRQQFEPRTGPYINLVKLHGSIDWWIAEKKNGQQNVDGGPPCQDNNFSNLRYTKGPPFF